MARKRKIRTRPYSYSDTEQVVEGGVRRGLNRAYKHFDGPNLPEERVQAIVDQVVRAVMTDLEEIISWEAIR